ncbi:nucleoporin pom152 [Colletotrichum truncatum]|uniref:Nucleoporin pom152 n=1 Tax=Colletotrichum truncatum TaxID=5467 RepID=A0ACC3Z5U0_COLTU|nr:nucleoporin pom152 [Colletotrichum truncatum]KAF6787243.1 nucleoporin pom152 [Colletotrichum truncatum]
MSATPRQRTGGFPQTPATAAPGRSRRHDPDPNSSVSSQQSMRTSSLPLAPENSTRGVPPTEPVIPLTILDAPQQRFYACAIYIGLLAWRFYDWIKLVEDNDTSAWLFLKWVFIDFGFLFGLPEMRIPWLELSQPVVMAIFLFHAFFNFMLMFNIPLPLQPWLVGFMKVFYDREVAVSEHTVKVSSILHNHSLIMGRQIINILPEGSAVLNFEQTPFCIGENRDTIRLPIQFNATVPAEMELIRIDLDTNQEEIIKLSSREVRKIAKQIKDQMVDSKPVAHAIEYPVKKTGVYRLGKVLDEYKLEVQRTTKDTYVVPCPKASFRTPENAGRCIRDLSDLFIDVVGTPPLKIQYSRKINGNDRSFHFQSLQPEDYNSPLLGSPSSQLTLANDDDTTWVKPQAVAVRLNETLDSAGEWQYAVDEVQDGFGNVQKYSQSSEETDLRPRPKHLVRTFLVKQRPRAQMRGCDLRNPIKVAKNNAAKLPVSFSIPERAPEDTSHTLTWEFSPIDSLTNGGDHGDKVSVGSYSAKNSHDKPSVREPGLYTLKTITSGSCEGEVQEPSSCLLLNPLEPQLSLRAEEIPDKCAGNSVGLRVDLDLIGTPPFKVRYDVVDQNGMVRRERVDVDGLRQQIELRPTAAGHHKYIFKQIDDSIYKEQPLSGPSMVLETDVKPAASAVIQHPTGSMSACLEEQVEVDVSLRGDAPFSLEWEIVHDGKRKSERVTGIEDSNFKIKTKPLAKGGEYTLALNSVQDKSGCRTFLKDELKISVRRQRPRAAFGLVENKRSIMSVENTKVDLPLRLQGVGPWTVSYRNIDRSDVILEKRATSGNDVLSVKARGVYEIIDVSDKQCPGTVDPQASRFEIDWYPRPEITLVQSDSITSEAAVYVKRDVCEGDIDSFEVNLKGSAPYHVEYDLQYKSFQGSGSGSSASNTRKEFDTALNKAPIRMDTSKPGDYTYKFSALADNLYNSDRNSHPLTLNQRVNAKPSAVFVKPGQSFKYCKTEQDSEDIIPITLSGVAPFYVEIEIKHHSGTVPETYRISSVQSNSYGIHIPRQHLRLGVQHVRIREVRDARGCQNKYETNAPSVQVHLYDAPAIYPLESRGDYCVGERIAYTLSGTPPFEIWYDFQGHQRKAKSGTTNFRRIAESPGDFIITSISDKASECRASVDITKKIHPLPAVKISRGRQTRVDIHEGNEVEILFEFWGTPPFEFTYTRSSNAKKGQKSVVLETRHDVSYESSKIIRASQEGTYEVVAIKDKFCAFSTQQVADSGKDQKMLQY